MPMDLDKAWQKVWRGKISPQPQGSSARGGAFAHILRFTPNQAAVLRADSGALERWLVWCPLHFGLVVNLAKNTVWVKVPGQIKKKLERFTYVMVGQKEAFFPLDITFKLGLDRYGFFVPMPIPNIETFQVEQVKKIEFNAEKRRNYNYENKYLSINKIITLLHTEETSKQLNEVHSVQ